MTRRARRISAAVTAITAAGVLGAPGLAQAATTDTGDLRSGPVSLQYTVTTNDDGSVSGTANGHLSLGTFGIADTTGPITCYQRQGNRIGLFYPMAKTDPSVVDLARGGIYMNITTDGAGTVKSVAYSIIPFKREAGCKPTGGIIPATGTVTTS